MAGRGRPAFAPTVEQRKLVEKLAGIGCTHQEILECVPWGKKDDKPIDQKTLVKHFGDELERGAALGSSRLRGKLYDEAMNGNTAALIFICKVRLGMREATRIEQTGADGQPLPPAQIVVLPAKDPRDEDKPVKIPKAEPQPAPPAPPAPAVEKPAAPEPAAPPPPPPAPPAPAAKPERPAPRAVGSVASGSWWRSAGLGDTP